MNALVQLMHRLGNALRITSAPAAVPPENQPAGPDAVPAQAADGE
jgi:hypothetical protein